jgi:hypothetical protein
MSATHVPRMYAALPGYYALLPGVGAHTKPAKRTHGGRRVASNRGPATTWAAGAARNVRAPHARTRATSCPEVAQLSVTGVGGLVAAASIAFIISSTVCLPL